MRMAVAACALAIAVFLAIFGVVSAQKDSQPAPAATPAATAAAPSPKGPTAVVTEVSGTRVATPAAQAAAGPTPAMVVAQAPSPTAAAAPAASQCAGSPNALGTARVVEIDTTGGPGFGFEHFKSHDFLRPGEVVLTFDDGPWPRNTPAVLAALAAHCTKATFFPIGKH